MTWHETTLELEELKLKFNPYHELKEKELTVLQLSELKSLRARCVELHYIRIGILNEKQIF